MKLNTLTKPVTHSAMTIAAAAAGSSGRARCRTIAVAAAMLQMPCDASRDRTDSPDRSSASPMAANAATAIARAIAAGVRISSAARMSPAAIGAPPPRGVGTEWDDRPFGMSMAAARRSSRMVTGSVARTSAPHEAPAIRVMSCGGTILDTSCSIHLT